MKYKTKKKELYYDKVISLYRDEKLGKRKISKIIPVGSSTISVWIRNFVENNPEAESEHMRKCRSIKTEESNSKEKIEKTEETDISALQQEVSRLKKELQKQTVRAEAYNEMISVAEKQFNISIRKKAGAKK